MKSRAVGKYLIVDPKICFGKLTFKGTRVPVSTVLTWLAKGKTIASMLRDWPYLSREAIVEAITVARDVLIQRYSPRGPVKNEPIHPGRAARSQRSSHAAAKSP